MKNGKVKIQVYCNTGFSGCDHNEIIEIDRAEWDSMSQYEQDKYLDEMAETNMINHIEYGAYVLED